MRDTVSRRQFLKAGAAFGAVAASVGSSLPAWASKSGQPVESRTLITSTAKFDPVRPEAARLIAKACQSIGFNLQANPIDYNQGIQKVIMEHDFEAFLVRLSGAAIRIDPNVFIYQLHHSSQHKSGGYNWSGYKNARVDELAAAQQAEMNAEKRKELVYEAQQLIYDDQPNHILVNPQMTNAYREDRIGNLVPQMGEGIGSFWTDINMTVLDGDGYVRTGATSPLKSMNPIAVKDNNEFLELRMIYDRLFRVGPDGKVWPWAAEGYTIVDPTTIDVSMRSGMKFHDGVDVTAEDVKFSFDYCTEYGAPFFAASLKKVDRIEVTGTHSFRVHLAEPYAPLFVSLFASLFILPKHIWRKIPQEVDVEDPLNYANEHPIGSGPFKFDYWDRGKELKVSANAEHFNPPKCAGIIRVVYGSHDAMAAAIEKGECDRTRYILKPSLMEDLNSVRGVVGKGYPSHGMYCMSYNTTIAPFDDPAFRAAMRHVMPIELIRDVVLGGHASTGGSVIAPANKFWHNSAVVGGGQNVKKAKDMLAAAGYTWKDGKLHYPG
ncbi:ABC transporter substrate-binding protein [Roseibium sp.]|uniref:ABC transporter substrate-binding protein n=1 Tax=Roseibium sp. TaxID=1936156 RepID=UPI003B51DDB0